MASCAPACSTIRPPAIGCAWSTGGSSSASARRTGRAARDLASGPQRATSAPGRAAARRLSRVPVRGVGGLPRWTAAQARSRDRPQGRPGHAAAPHARSRAADAPGPATARGLEPRVARPHPHVAHRVCFREPHVQRGGEPSRALRRRVVHRCPLPQPRAAPDGAPPRRPREAGRRARARVGDDPPAATARGELRGGAVSALREGKAQISRKHEHHAPALGTGHRILAGHGRVRAHRARDLSPPRLARHGARSRRLPGHAPPRAAAGALLRAGRRRWLRDRESAVKIAIFIDHDIILRHFVQSDVLAALETDHDVVWIFPDRHRRVKTDPATLRLGRYRTVAVSELRLNGYRRLYHATVLRRLRHSRDKRPIFAFWREVLGRRGFWTSWCLSWPGIYHWY